MANYIQIEFYRRTVDTTVDTTVGTTVDTTRCSVSIYMTRDSISGVIFTRVRTVLGIVGRCIGIPTHFFTGYWRTTPDSHTLLVQYKVL